MVIDTDMSVDDWMAILFLLQRTDVSVKAITVAGTGVAHGAPGARNAIRLLDLVGRRDIPVAYGRATTYPGGHAFPAEWRPALDSMLGIGLPPPSRSVSRLSAAELIANVTAKSPVEILELGPPTNVADALRATPALRKRVTSVTLMSGALNVAGNAPGQKADWNFYVDPRAADIVLRSGIPWTLVPLDATSAVPYNEPFFRRLAANPKTKATRFVHEALSRQMPGEGLYFWDPFAAALLVDHSVATLGQRTIRIVATGVDAGRTVEAADGTQVRVALEGKQERFEELFLATLNAPAAAAKATPTSRAAPKWVNTGPEGGSFAELTIHPKQPRVVYASSFEGFFRSADGGASWQRRPAPRYLTDIALDPEDPQTVYAVAGAGIYRTRDGGASWTGLLSALGVPCPGTCPILFLVAVSPSSPQVVYAVSSQSAEQLGIWLWRSTDAGVSWSRTGRIIAGGQWDSGWQALVDPLQPATVYVRVRAKGVFRSDDGGKTWAGAGAGLPAGKLSSLAVDPARPGVLYAGTRSGEVFGSVDHGRSWTVSAHGLGGEVSGIAVSAADGAVYAGTSPPGRTDGVEIGGGAVYRSADGRAPWRRADRSLSGWYVAALAADATTPGRVLAATERGIFASQDGGAAWAASMRGLVASNPVGLAVDPANPRLVFTAVERGIAVSRDGGRTWRPSLDVRGTRARIGPLLAVPGRPATIYAVMVSVGAPRSRWTLLVSRDAGRTWATVGPLPVEMGALVADPSSPTTLYGIRGRAPWPRGSIFKSVDGGRNWKRIYSAARKPPACALAVDPLNPRVLYAGLFVPWNQGSPLLKSEDGGHTWRQLQGFGSGLILALAADPRRRDTLYAVRSGDWVGNVRMSRDGGRTWAESGRSPDAGSLLVDPVRPDVVYIGGQEGVYVKEAGSTKWRQVRPAGTWSALLAVDAKGRRLYAGISSGGVAATPLPFVPRPS